MNSQAINTITMVSERFFWGIHSSHSGLLLSPYGNQEIVVSTQEVERALDAVHMLYNEACYLSTGGLGLSHDEVLLMWLWATLGGHPNLVTWQQDSPSSSLGEFLLSSLLSGFPRASSRQGEADGKSTGSSLLVLCGHLPASEHGRTPRPSRVAFPC